MSRNQLQRGSAYLERRREHHATLQVWYARGAQSVQGCATIGRWVFRVLTSDGIWMESESRDYLWTAEKLVLNGTPIFPKAGDMIIEESLTTGPTYQVMAPANEQVWRWSDSFRKTFRIHTKYIGLQPLTS